MTVATTPIHSAIDALAAERDQALGQVVSAQVEIDRLLAANLDLQAQLDALRPPLLLGVNYPGRSEVAPTTPKVVRIFASGAVMNTATSDALRWCQANGVRPIVSFVTYPNPIGAATLDQLATLCPSGGWFTVNHESANPAKSRSAATCKTIATTSYGLAKVHAPMFDCGDIFMAWDLNSGLASRHPELWRSTNGTWVGFDTYDSNPPKADPFAKLIEKPAAWAKSQGLDVVVPEFACRPDRVGGAGFRDAWIPAAVDDMRRLGVRAGCWFTAETGAPPEFAPEYWHLPTGGGQATYRSLI